MFRPGTVSETDYSPPSTKRPQGHTLESIREQIKPKGQIQKIYQEGSKNTYVIIVNKDCLGSSSLGSALSTERESSEFRVSNNCKYSSSNDEKSRNLLLENHRDVRRNLTDLNDRDFDSPTPESSRNVKCRSLKEDIKLNLTNINDDDYDSGFSSTSVFLKPELLTGNDSAIDLNSSGNAKHKGYHCVKSRSFIHPKSKMNSYVIQSPLAVQKKRASENSSQHSFPMISPQCVGSRAGVKLAYSTPILCDKQSSHTAARKIFVPGPGSTDNADNNNGSYQIPATYTNEAVPIMGKSKLNSPNSSGMAGSWSNPKAVPTLSNISPIQTVAMKDSANSQLPSSYLSQQSSTSSPSDMKEIGPLTSTPLDPRINELRQESATHRSVYHIQSPFTSRQNTSAIDATKAFNKPQVIAQTSNSPLTLSSSSLNNSSGFVSGSCSLELSEIDSPRPNSDIKENHIVIEKMDLYSELTSCDHPIPADMKFEPKSFHVPVTVSVSQDGVVNVEKEVEDLGLGTDDDISSSQDSTASVEKAGILNTSLTNMQWLKGMQLKEEEASRQASAASNYHSSMPSLQWKGLSQRDVKRISDECGLEKRPPFSYMSMIQMALYSREDTKMMLKEICKWIEDTFPYYRHTAKPGWKNSIRHNLSLYNIFVREPSKRHGSYWTIKPDIEPRTKQYRDRQSNSSTPLPSQSGVIPLIPMYSSMGQLSAVTPQQICAATVQGTSTPAPRKRGNVPILPRPSPYSTPQAYALIPIQSMNQPFAMSSQPQHQPPVIVSLSNAQPGMSTCSSPVINEVSAAVASIQVSSPIPREFCETPIHEPVAIRSKPINMVRQAWLDSQNIDTASDSELTSSNDIASSSEYSGNRTKSKRPRDKPGLPKPTLYSQTKTKKVTGSKRRKLQQKERCLLQDSSDEEDDGARFLSNLEKDLTTPLKMLDTNDVDDLLTTSTPYKSDAHGASPQLPSPIRGLTPLRSAGLFDGSFMDSLAADNKALGLSPDVHSARKFSPDISQKLTQSPNLISDLNELPLLNTPNKMDGSPDSNTSLENKNLSRFLSDYVLDSCETESFPNLNWSTIQQMVDNMDET